MKKKLVTYLAVGTFLTLLTGVANATIITFDTFNNDSSYTESGMTFEALAPSTVFNVDSGQWISKIYNATDDFAEFYLDSGDTFGLNSIYATHQDGGTDPVKFDGYLNGSIVSSLTLQSYNGSYSFTGAFSMVDKVKVSSLGSTWNDWSFDNLDFDSAPVNPVPEPTTVLLFGLGLAGLVGSRLRKKK